MSYDQLCALQIADEYDAAMFEQRHANDYREAMIVLWRDAGAWAHDTFDELNTHYFDGEIPQRGVVWGLTPHGGALAHCHSSGRITLHPALLDPRSDAWKIKRYLGEAYARDVLLHEMIHALLFARGIDHKHNSQPWCDQVMRLAPMLGLGDVKAAPVQPRRINGKVVRRELDGHLSQLQLARFPHESRDQTWYERNRRRMPVLI